MSEDISSMPPFESHVDYENFVSELKKYYTLFKKELEPLQNMNEIFLNKMKNNKPTFSEDFYESFAEFKNNCSTLNSLETMLVSISTQYFKRNEKDDYYYFITYTFDEEKKANVKLFSYLKKDDYKFSLLISKFENNEVPDEVLESFRKAADNLIEKYCKEENEKKVAKNKDDYIYI